MTTVLVTGLFTPAGLFAVRWFGRLGFQVTAADPHPLAFGMHSRYVSRRVRLPSPRNRLAYQRAIAKELDRGYDFFFPAFEEALPLAEIRDEIEKKTRTLLPDSALAQLVHNKASLQRVLAQANLPVPETWEPTSFHDIRNLANTIKHPVIIKMRESRNSTGVRFVHDPKEITPHFQDITDRNHLSEGNLPIIQRWVRGNESCVLALVDRGRLVGLTMYAAIRSWPRRGGTTVARTTIAAPAVQAVVEKLVSHLNWTGFIGLDVIEETSTGKSFIIDCNPRPTVGIALSHAGGDNFLRAWMELCQGRSVPSLPATQAGLKSKTEFADLIWLGSTLTDPRATCAQRGHALLSWLRDSGYQHDIADCLDPAPLGALLLFLGVQLKKLFRGQCEAGQLFLEHNSV